MSQRPAHSTALTDPYALSLDDTYPRQQKDKDKKTLRAWWRRVTADKDGKNKGVEGAQVQDKSVNGGASGQGVGPVTEAHDGGQPHRGIFHVPLVESIAYASVPISYVDDETGQQCFGVIPTIVAKCGSFLKDQGKCTFTEGVFRLSGSAKRIGQLQQIFDTPPHYGANLDWRGYSVHDAANILRRYLNYLPEPVITHSSYMEFRAAMDRIQDDDARVDEFQRLIQCLPLPHQFLLLYLLDLLAVFASQSDNNRMDSTNLAAVFTPGLLFHPTHEMSPAQYRISQRVVEFLIEWQGSFTMPKKSATLRLEQKFAMMGVSLDTADAGTSKPLADTTVQAVPAPVTPLVDASLFPTAPPPSTSPLAQSTLRQARRHQTLDSDTYMTSASERLDRQNGSNQRPAVDAVSSAHRLSAHFGNGSRSPSSIYIPQPNDTAQFTKFPTTSKGAGLYRSKTAPTRRARYGNDDPVQVVHVGRNNSQDLRGGPPEKSKSHRRRQHDSRRKERYRKKSRDDQQLQTT
ncbi:hypothetical protein BZG36_03794 [Bifiguratus adelaidae]|uniref:Rho-GAP domain-containing protein n=1 Tax=Bifiguratus adelaidae TaxID=1938954 RepID=A0A261XX20_9FUNG|nr:hypothetical protein BZG36_03794 [Bifiguratus adelaidae]